MISEWLIWGRFSLDNCRCVLPLFCCHHPVGRLPLDFSSCGSPPLLLGVAYIDALRKTIAGKVIFKGRHSSQIEGHLRSENGIKTEVFLSSEFELEPGSVSDKYFNNIDFPRGHIAIKNFNAEVVDEKGNPIPLHETYLHHWLLLRYYYRRGFNIPNNHGYVGLQSPDHTVVKNNGVCDSELPLYFGLGAETRRIEMDVPDPYGIEVGNPEDIPEGYNEGWILNVHIIDTRGAEDKMGCAECRCDLYNVTIDEHGVVLPEGYRGGMKCCYAEARCRVKEGFWGVKRKLYLRYTVKYVDWDASIVPVRIYILDVTETWTKARHHCSVWKMLLNQLKQ